MTRKKRAVPIEALMRGIGVSHGEAVGPALVIKAEEDHFVEREIGPDEIDREVLRFERAVIATRRQIKDIQHHVGGAIGKGDARILDVHLMVLDDGFFLEEAIQKIRDSRRNAESAVKLSAQKYAEALSTVEDEYLRERVADIRDVARRILRNLSGRQGSPVSEIRKKSILVASDLGPSETAMLRRDLVLAFATDFGSGLSHTAIMARALGIPAVVGLHDVTQRVSAGDDILVDGDKGIVVVHPSAACLEQYGKMIEARQKLRRDLITTLRDQPAVTVDGHRIVLSANMELEEEIEEVRRHGAEGVGLFRSEFLFLTRGEPPSEEEQFGAYARVAEALAPDPVIIRTLDSGGDKLVPSLKLPHEMNPFMGFRAIRFCLAQPELFKSQMRAILRASRSRNVRIMYPMISDVSEVIHANALLDEVRDELRQKRVPFDEQIEVGAMIETPSAALTAEAIAPHVKFFSLGTNDLTQYTMAADRVNDMVAYLYMPTHPGVLKLIKHTIDVAHRHGIWAGVCGEMAGDPLMAPLLLGLGADEFSTAPSVVPLVKSAVRSLHYSQCVELAAKALAMDDASAIVALCREMVAEAAPEILELIA